MPRRRSHPNLQKMTKVYRGTKEGFVCLTSRNWRIRYFERLMSPLIPFIQDGISYTTWSQANLLVVRNKYRCCRVCCSLRHLSESQDRASMTRWDVATFASTRVEVGRGYYEFYRGIAKTQSGYDSLWVIVNRLTKVAHFIHIQMIYTRPQLA
jgi:hypothetical protein